MDQFVQALEANGVSPEAFVGVLAILGAVGLVAGIIAIVAYIVRVIADIKVFQKAGEKGWKSLIPFYNTYILFKISWKTSMFWITLVLALACGILQNYNNLVCNLINLAVAIALLVISIKQCGKLSKAFGHGKGFAVGLFFLPFLFSLILGFGKSQYVGNPCIEEAPAESAE